MSISSRLANLENDARADRGVIVMWRHHWESDDQARSRWLAEHPGRSLDESTTRVIIIRWAGEQKYELPRVCRRLFGLSHAASFCSSSLA